MRRSAANRELKIPPCQAAASNASAYIGDLSQFCHLMSPSGPWGDDEATLHSKYEEVIDKTGRLPRQDELGT